MEFVVRHFIAGRVRLYIPSLRRRTLAESVLQWLRGHVGIKRARFNRECASLVVEYDLAHEALLRTILGRLALMGIDELRAVTQPAMQVDRISSRGEARIQSKMPS